MLEDWRLYELGWSRPPSSSGERSRPRSKHCGALLSSHRVSPLSYQRATRSFDTWRAEICKRRPVTWNQPRSGFEAARRGRARPRAWNKPSRSMTPGSGRSLSRTNLRTDLQEVATDEGICWSNDPLSRNRERTQASCEIFRQKWYNRQTLADWCLILTAALHNSLARAICSRQRQGRGARS